MSNRYLDESGETIGRNLWLSTIKHRSDAIGFFKLMGIKEVTTKRQKKNGTTVYELPIRKLSYTGNSYAYRYAIYDSGYIRNVSEHCHSPWYINKRYETNEMYWNSYYKKYTKYKTSKAAFINNFDDQLVYLANYILKNRYGSKLYSCCDWNIEQITECSDFRYKARWDGDTVTISRDEYNDLQKAKPLAKFEDTVSIPRDTYIKFKEAYDRQSDEIQVIINGQRYNLS